MKQVEEIERAVSEDYVNRMQRQHARKQTDRQTDRQTDQVEIRENSATVVGESTRTKRIVRPDGRLATSVERQTTLPNSADLPLLESSTSSGESFKKSGDKLKCKNSGKSVHQIDHTHSDEDHDLYLWSVYQKKVNSVNKPLVTITIHQLKS